LWRKVAKEFAACIYDSVAVAVLPRGSIKKGDQRLWRLKEVRKDGDSGGADLELLGVAQSALDLA